MKLPACRKRAEVAATPRPGDWYRGPEPLITVMMTEAQLRLMMDGLGSRGIDTRWAATAALKAAGKAVSI